MTRFHKPHAAVLMLALMLGLPTVATAQVIPSNVVNLDVPIAGGWSITPTGLNDHGVVTANIGCNCGPNAMLWDKVNGWRSIGGVGPYWTYPEAINNNGVVTAMNLAEGMTHNAGLMWDPAGQWREMLMGPGNGTFPKDINDNNVVVGGSWNGGFMYSESAGPTFLADINPVAINNAGQIVGTSPTDSYDVVVRDADGAIRHLAPGQYAMAYDINAAGQVAGQIYTGGLWQAAVWAADGTLTVIPPMGGTDDPEWGRFEQAVATAINDQGQVVGSTTTQWGSFVPFVWDPVSGRQEVVFSGYPGWVRPVAINNNGEVIAVMQAGHDRGVYFTVPPPPPPDPGYTPAGTNVQAVPVDDRTGGSPVTITFANVTNAGSTTLETSTSWIPAPPSNFKIGFPPIYYDLHTTATFAGSATVCINYTGQSFLFGESSLRVLHLENGTWRDRTVSLNTTTNTICASVTSFSPFVIVQPNYASLSITPSTVKRGKLVKFSASVTNPSTTERKWMMVDIATSGSCLPTIARDLPVLLGKGETKSLSFPLPVLPRACLGTYTVTLSGKIDGVLVGESAATLTVTP